MRARQMDDKYHLAESRSSLRLIMDSSVCNSHSLITTCVWHSVCFQQGGGEGGGSILSWQQKLLGLCNWETTHFNSPRFWLCPSLGMTAHFTLSVLIWLNCYLKNSKKKSSFVQRKKSKVFVHCIPGDIFCEEGCKSLITTRPLVLLLLFACIYYHGVDWGRTNPAITQVSRVSLGSRGECKPKFW